MTDSGYIKLFREISEAGYYKKSEYIHLWVHLLLKANFKKTKIVFCKKEIVINRGQFVTGRKKLSQETGIKESTIENILKLLETEQQIKQQKFNLFRLITITNYNKFQNYDSKIDNKVTTKKQQSNNKVTHLKNDKNDKKEEKERDTKVSPKKSLSDLFSAIENNFTETELTHKTDFVNYWTEKNPNGKKERWEFEKVFDVSRRFKTWLRNSERKFEKGKQNANTGNRNAVYVAPADRRVFKEADND